MALISSQTLDKYLALNFNVLFEGAHGIGKTAIVKQTFERANYKWLYFSASTLDPWIDLVGVPTEVKTPTGSYMDLIRPKFIIDDEVDAIFFDELNRADKKVLNAVMELIQFKSINGKRLSNLKVIWGAINPHDEAETYSVQELDPAQLDRFHAHIKLPYEVDRELFESKYGRVGAIFADWWRALPGEIKLEVSPRRLEYAILGLAGNADLKHMLPLKSNIAKLLSTLKAESFSKQLQDAMGTEKLAAKLLGSSANVEKLLNDYKDEKPLAKQFFSKWEHLISRDIVDAFNEKFAASLQAMTSEMHSADDEAERLQLFQEIILCKEPTTSPTRIANVLGRVLMKNDGMVLRADDAANAPMIKMMLNRTLTSISSIKAKQTKDEVQQALKMLADKFNANIMEVAKNVPHDSQYRPLDDGGSLLAYAILYPHIKNPENREHIKRLHLSLAGDRWYSELINAL